MEELIHLITLLRFVRNVTQQKSQRISYNAETENQTVKRCDFYVIGSLAINRIT